MHYNHNFKINIEEIHQIKFTIPQKFFFFLIGLNYTNMCSNIIVFS